MTRAKQDMIAAACCEFGPATSEEELRAALDTIDRLRRRPDASNAPEVAMLMVTRAELAEAIKAKEAAAAEAAIATGAELDNGAAGAPPPDDAANPVAARRPRDDSRRRY